MSTSRVTTLALVTAGLAAACLVGAAGCSSPSPESFANTADGACEKAQQEIADLETPPNVTDLHYAITYYTQLDRMVSELREARLPAGQAGDEIRAKWLDPAQQSLEDFFPELSTIRVATQRGDTEMSQKLVRRLQEVMGSEVDHDYVTTLGANSCTEFFG